MFTCVLLNFLKKATELCILEFMSHLESQAVDGIDIVGTGTTEEKKKKKMIERMAENLHHMVRNSLCVFFMSPENKLQFFYSVLKCSSFCAISFVLTVINVFLCTIRQGFCGCVLSKSEAVGLGPAVCMNVQQPALNRLG